MIKKFILLLILFLFLVACENIEEITAPYELGADPINASQFGFVMEEDEWFYYFDGESSNNISRTNGSMTETYENTYGRGMQIHEEDLYFANYGGVPGLFRLHKDGKDNSEKVVDIYISDYIIVNDYVFYATNKDEHSGIYRASLDGEENVQLVKGRINHMQWVDGWIYYAIPTEGKVLRMNTAGNETMELKTDEDINISTTEFIVIDDWIYFENRDTNFVNFHLPKDKSHNIFRMKLDGTQVESLVNGRLNNYLPSGPYVIYTSESRDQLLRMDLDGSNKTVLYNGDKTWDWVNQIDHQLYLIDWNSDGVTNVYYYDSENRDLKKIGN